MNHTGFLEMHANYATAMRTYFSEMEKTAMMLKECTAEPLSFKDRFGLISQAIIENDAHLTFLAAKSLLFSAARLGFGFSN